MTKNNLYQKIYEKECIVCGHKYFGDFYGQGRCNNCTWYNNKLGEENENSIIYPNVVSLSKAKELSKNNSALKPDLNDFLGMFDFYGEVCFEYNGLSCQLDQTENEDEIEFGWSPESIQYFKSHEDFMQNAKIGDEYVRDIWDKVKDPRYM